jgi:hypothetical protein
MTSATGRQYPSTPAITVLACLSLGVIVTADHYFYHSKYSLQVKNMQNAGIRTTVG